MRSVAAIVIVSLAAVMAAAAEGAQPATPPADPNAAPASPASQPAGSLLLGRQPVPMTPPSFAVTAPPKRKEDTEEGLVVELRCRLTRQADSGWFVIEPVGDAPDQPTRPYRVLPSPELEVLEQLTGQDAAKVFSVTGQQTFYKQQAYILLQTISESAPPAETSTSDPNASAGPPSADNEPPAKDLQGIIHTLTRNKPPKPVEIPTSQPEASAEQPTEAQQEAGQYPSGGMIVDRTIRVVSSADRQWLEAHFVADNNLQERPLLLLPCRLLERAEKISGKMRVTGIIRHYKGRDYLLLRKVLPERNMGQL